MSEDEIRGLAPSVFVVTAHESRSERFRPIWFAPIGWSGFNVHVCSARATLPELKPVYFVEATRWLRVLEVCSSVTNAGAQCCDVVASLR